MIPGLDVVVIADTFCDFAVKFIKIAAVLENKKNFKVGQEKENRGQGVDVVDLAGPSCEDDIHMRREDNQRDERLD